MSRFLVPNETIPYVMPGFIFAKKIDEMTQDIDWAPFIWNNHFNDCNKINYLYFAPLQTALLSFLRRSRI